MIYNNIIRVYFNKPKCSIVSIFLHGGNFKGVWTWHSQWIQTHIRWQCVF